MWAQPALLRAQPAPVVPPVQLQELFPSASRTQLRDTCSASSYTLTLLLQGYKFNHTTWPDIHFVQQVGGVPGSLSFHTLCPGVPCARPAAAGTRGQQGSTAPVPVARAALELLGHLAWPFMLSPTFCHCWGLCSPRWAQKWWVQALPWFAWYFAAFPIPLSHLSAQVAGTDVGWPLGYMLNLSSMVPSEPPAAVTGLPRSVWIAATALLAVMLVLTSCLLTATCCHRSSPGYEQL